MKIVCANPRGFCAGVDRAIAIVERALERIGPPIYVRHEVVHNETVVARLRAAGAIFTDDLQEVPDGATLIFSAHGVSQAVRQQARQKGCQVFDATCPLVTKVHIEVARCAKRGQECVLIGHAGHPEVEGTLGQYRCSSAGIFLVETIEDAHQLQLVRPDQAFLVTQTTLSVLDTQAIIDVLRSRFPAIQSPKTEDICYATTNRQRAVQQLAEQCDVVLVVGSKSSSNSNRLRELAEHHGCDAYLIDGAEDLRREWFVDPQQCTVGLTAGASAPEALVQAVIAQCQAWWSCTVEELSGVAETMVFPLPRRLRE